ncbi:MAG: hypothetical protein C0621_00115 [Desulfuromonas sp.]|nr:MAG: hypothetical protein C0621_00115 [Desulfuromonas sp.]
MEIGVSTSIEKAQDPKFPCCKFVYVTLDSFSSGRGKNGNIIYLAPFLASEYEITEAFALIRKKVDRAEKEARKKLRSMRNTPAPISKKR